jgi:hypothetical protein
MSSGKYNETLFNFLMCETCKPGYIRNELGECVINKHNIVCDDGSAEMKRIKNILYDLELPNGMLYKYPDNSKGTISIREIVNKADPKKTDYSLGRIIYELNRKVKPTFINKVVKLVKRQVESNMEGVVDIFILSILGLISFFPGLNKSLSSILFKTFQNKVLPAMVGLFHQITGVRVSNTGNVNFKLPNVDVFGAFLKDIKYETKYSNLFASREDEIYYSLGYYHRIFTIHPDITNKEDKISVNEFDRRRINSMSRTLKPVNYSTVYASISEEYILKGFVYVSQTLHALLYRKHDESYIYVNYNSITGRNFTEVESLPLFPLYQDNRAPIRFNNAQELPIHHFNYLKDNGLRDLINEKQEIYKVIRLYVNFPDNDAKDLNEKMRLVQGDVIEQQILTDKLVALGIKKNNSTREFEKGHNLIENYERELADVRYIVAFKVYQPDGRRPYPITRLYFSHNNINIENCSYGYFDIQGNIEKN